MEKLFQQTESKADKLLEHCCKLDALGQAISALGWYEDHHGGAETLTRKGEQLGMIISDYAMIIHNSLDGAYGVLNEFFGCDCSFLYELRTAYREIKRMQDYSMVIEATEKNIGLVQSTSFDKLPAEDLMEIMEIEQELRRMRAAILKYQKMEEQKEAPAKVDDQTAEAPSPDQN